MRKPNEEDNVIQIKNAEEQDKDKKNIKIEEPKKEKPNKEEPDEEKPDEEYYYAIIPPNGGWGWVVVLSALYCNIVVDGIQFTFGVFLEPISESFDSPPSEVSLAGSLMFGTHLILGPLCAGCNNAFGLRPVTITGSLICCFGVGISYFSTGYVFLCCSYGLIGGVGFGLVYMNTLVITSLYFTTLLPVAIGIVFCGGGLGTMIFSGIGSAFIRLTTWRNSLLMEAALIGAMALAAIAFRPLKPIKVKLSPSTSPRTDGKVAGTSEARNSVFIKTDVPSGTSLSSQVPMQDLAWNFARNVAAGDLEEEKKRKCSCSKCCRRKKDTSEDEVVIKLTEIKAQNEDSRRNTYVGKDIIAKPEHKKGGRRSVRESTAPQPTTTYKRLELRRQKAKDKIWTGIKTTITTLLDCTLLRSFTFFIFTFTGALQIAAQLVVFIYEKGRAEDLGYGENMSLIFLLVLGGTNVLWRLVLGIFSAFIKVNNKLALIIGTVLGGVATLCSGFYTNIYTEFVFCVFFSLSTASSSVFRFVLMVELVGVDRVATATGINLLFMGVFCVIFPPVFGLIMEATESYQVIFSITGVLIIISGLMMICMGKVKLEEKKRSSVTA